MHEKIIYETLWYFINTFNYSYNTWWTNYFSVINSKEKEKNISKTIEGLLTGNLLSFFVINILEDRGFKVNHNKNNPFWKSNPFDIDFQDRDLKLFLKWTTNDKIFWQIKPSLLKKYQNYNGYFLIAHIDKKIILYLAKLFELYIRNGWVLAENKRIINIEEVKTKIPKINKIDLLKWITIYGLISIKDYNKIATFVPYGNYFWITKYKQTVKEWTYYVNKNTEYKKLKEIL